MSWSGRGLVGAAVGERGARYSTLAAAARLYSLVKGQKEWKGEALTGPNGAQMWQIE